MQFSFSHFYWLINRVPEVDLESIYNRDLDADGDGRLSDNELRSLAAIVQGNRCRDLLGILLVQSAIYCRKYTCTFIHSRPVSKDKLSPQDKMSPRTFYPRTSCPPGQPVLGQYVSLQKTWSPQIISLCARTLVVTQPAVTVSEKLAYSCIPKPY